MNILIISPWESSWSMGKGKGTLSEIRFLQELIKRNHSIFYICFSKKSICFSKRNIGFLKNVKYYPLKTPFKSWYIRYKISKKYNDFKIITGFINLSLRFKEWFLFVFKAFILGFKIIKRNHIDLIIGFSPYGSFVSTFLGKYFKISSVGKFFGVHDFYTQNFNFKHKIKRFETHLSFKFHPNGIIIDNDGTYGDKIVSQYHISNTKYIFLSNGVNLDWAKFKKTKEELRKELNLPQDKKIILSISRLDEYKRIDRIIKIIPSIIRYFKKVLFLIIGDGFKKNELIYQVKSLKIEEYVKFIKAIPQKKIKNYLYAANLFISLSDITNKTCSVQEALICGCPTVVLNTGAVTEIIKNEENGIIIEKENLAKLPCILIDLLCNDKKREFISKKAQEFALNNFILWEEKVKREVDFIEKTSKLEIR